MSDRAFCFSDSNEMKSFHVFTAKLLIEEISDDDGFTCDMLQHVMQLTVEIIAATTGRQTRIASLTLEPLRILEKQDDI